MKGYAAISFHGKKEAHLVIKSSSVETCEEVNDPMSAEPTLVMGYSPVNHARTKG